MAQIQLIIDKLNGDQDYLDVEAKIDSTEDSCCVTIEKIIGGLVCTGDDWEEATPEQNASMLRIVSRAIDAGGYNIHEDLKAIWFNEALKPGETFGVDIKLNPGCS